MISKIIGLVLIAIILITILYGLIFLIKEDGWEAIITQIIVIAMVLAGPIGLYLLFK